MSETHAPREIAPEELIDETGRPRPLPLAPRRASELAAGAGLALGGDDRDVTGFAYLSTLRRAPGPGRVVYLDGPRHAAGIEAGAGLVVVTRPDVAAHVPGGNTMLISDAPPGEVFHGLLHRTARAGGAARLAGHVAPGARVHPTAVVSENVWIEDGAEIGAHVALLPNTRVGRGALVKPGATIGGNGFQVSTIDGERTLVAHLGGVWIGDGVTVGSSSCIDNGMTGDFTLVGDGCKIDNLVHYSHSAVSGRGCCICATAVICGSVTLGDGVWVAPHVVVNQHLHVGDHCYLGTGSVVTRDLPAHALAYGVPAARRGWVCSCRAKLGFPGGGGATRCASCGLEWTLAGGEVAKP